MKKTTDKKRINIKELPADLTLNQLKELVSGMSETDVDSFFNRFWKERRLCK